MVKRIFRRLQWQNLFRRLGTGSKGGVVNRRLSWFYVNWATNYPSLADVHINLQETFTVLLVLERWKESLRDK